MNVIACLLLTLFISCTKYSLSFPSAQVSAPPQDLGFNLTQPSFSISEDGIVVGSPLIITRTDARISQSLSLELEAITADETDLSLSSLVLTFLPGEFSKTVSPVQLGVVDDPTLEGDEFLRIKLTNPTDGGFLGPFVSGRLNVLDTEIAENFFFQESVVTAIDLELVARIKIGRTGNLAAAATVNLAFIDGTAVNGLHYSGIPQVVSFGPQVSEVFAVVPVSNVSSPSQNKSFYVELKSPSAGSSLRPWATAKVRILDADGPQACDELNTNLSVSSGFGGGAGTTLDPFKICSLFHLTQVRNNLTSSFKLTKDLDTHPDNDADPETPGAQTVLPIVGNFSGTFDGQEYSLKNFRFTKTVATGNPLAFFERAGGNVSVKIERLNFEAALLKNLIPGNHSGGIVGQIDSSINTLSDNSFSGKIESTGNGSASMILNRSNSTLVGPLLQNFAHGSIKTVSGHGGGIISGVFFDDSHSNLQKNFAVVNLQTGNTSGGLIGSIEGPSQLWRAQATIDSSHFKGLINVSNGNAGGLTGYTVTTGLCDMTISNSSSAGYVIGTEHVGGLVGNYFCRDSFCGITNSSSNASAKILTSGPGSLLGGIAGSVDTDGNLDFLNVQSAGIVHLVQGNAKAGGFVGQLRFYGNNKTVNVTNSTASSLIDGTFGSSVIGGFFGEIRMQGGSGQAVRFTNSRFLGKAFGANDSYAVGGFVGELQMEPSGSTRYFVISNSQMTGEVRGYRQTGGYVGNVVLDPSGGAVFEVSDSLMSGSVEGVSGRWVGGIVGGIRASGLVRSTLNFENLSVSGPVIGGDQYTGGVSGIVSLEGANHSTQILNVNLTGPVLGSEYIGALLGSYVQSPTSTMINLNITSILSTTPLASGAFVGGLIGSLDFDGSGNTAVLSDLHSSASVTAGGFGVLGGIIGYLGCQSASGPSSVSLINSSHVGAVIGTGDHVGGIAGVLTTNSAGCTLVVRNSFASGSVSGNSKVGGVAGSMSHNSMGSVTLENSYSSSLSLSGASNVGGLIGNPGTGVTVTSSYWLKEGLLINPGVPDDGNQRTVVQLETPANYTGWDFMTVWFSPTAGAYPLLR